MAYARGYPSCYNKHQSLMSGSSPPPPPPPPSTPNPPDIVSDTLNFDGLPGAIGIDFVADSDNQTTTVFDPLLYYMQYSETSGSGFTTFGDAWTLPVDERTVTLIGLQFNTTYYMRSAVDYDNGGTQTEYSEEYVVTTPAPPPGPAPEPYFGTFSPVFNNTEGTFQVQGVGTYDPTWYTTFYLNESLDTTIAENVGDGTYEYNLAGTFDQNFVFRMESKLVASPDAIYGACDFYTTETNYTLPGQLFAVDHNAFSDAYDLGVVPLSDPRKLYGSFGGKAIWIKVTCPSELSNYTITTTGDENITVRDESLGILYGPNTSPVVATNLVADSIIYIVIEPASFEYFEFQIT